MISTQQVQFTDASTACVGYQSGVNTITINCDASFLDVVQAINDPEILEQEEEQEGQYILNANLEVADGVTFEMTSEEDSLQYLKITGANGIIVHGRIEISGIIITSWDTETDSPISQTETGSVPRAFINLRVSEGGFIEDSEAAFLGYDAPPRRGIDLGESTDGPSHDFAIRNSRIHDNWMGFYSAGAYNIIIDGNEFYGNIRYAIDPHTGTNNMTVSNNEVYNNRGIAVICSLDCYDVIFEGNEVYNNAGSGLMFSRATHDSIIRNNIIYNQYESAYPISISESQNNEIYGNTITNSTGGISVHNPLQLDEDGMSSDNRIYDNTFDGVQNAMRAVASSNNTFSSNVFGNVTDFHYIMTSNASMDIENQIFDMANIRGVSGSNTLSIRDSGTIVIDNTTNHDTEMEPYTQILSGQTVNVNSARE
ncbi:MAG: right-handed parallel beta-helix repeat-containing protein [Thermoproteota archaeon]|nr:right-handed parallel beta-helix repeat-containing protein [Thermoproteota archaeon]